MLNPLNGIVATGAAMAGVGMGVALGLGLAVAAHGAMMMEPKK
ncbi:hypothetical protein PARPLA_01885 [Rhodobacteraceae bacterium THAF1]|nr:hypothetical protein [Palleronia sp. THAF1]QFU08980.1 hypothetical protein FIU81_09875 [Palleronia sp. THAF1]VDC24281.1 hypothetical protein PARPLA_01885 [Rhodobacteraceae bacterium THAF1]